MKSSFGGRPGQVNLKGKKSMTLSCRCCEVQNFKDRELEREAKREINKTKLEYIVPE